MTDWSQLVQQHGQMVWKTAFRLVSHEADAADCFQNTFVAALELSRQQTVRNWPGLLKRLATMQALERLRQRYRSARRQSELYESGLTEFSAAQPETNIHELELTTHLRQALSELDPLQSQVFCLCCLEEQSYQEVAADFGLTVNHVGVLLNRAKTGLRLRMKAFSPTES